jgi:hypothetical protein
VTFSEPWHLRSGVQFLDEVTEALYDGGAWITPDASFPDDFVGALQNRLHDDRWRVASLPAAGPDKPLIRVAEVFDVSPTRLALATPALSQHVVVVDLRDALPAETAPWVEFATRFAPIRSKEGTGLSLCVLSQAAPPPDMRAPAWLGRIRRADAALWADMHAQTDRPEPLGHPRPDHGLCRADADRDRLGAPTGADRALAVVAAAVHPRWCGAAKARP